MMQTSPSVLTTRTSVQVVGALAFAAIVFMGAALLKVRVGWALGVLALACAAGAAGWLWRRRLARRSGSALSDALGRETSTPPAHAGRGRLDECESIKQDMLQAITTIKNSRLGRFKGDAALYELPWYMVIGNPAAGKSTAITHSGLRFPLSEDKIVRGVGGTRNCDWFFTSEGILLDTAGRFAVADEDRAEWRGFLGLLKKYRKKAPINGIIVAVSVPEVCGNGPEFAISLAKNLRARVQELTEELEVHAPVYVLFTKTDLIKGFNAFFHTDECPDPARTWGATLPYGPATDGAQALDQFTAHFDALHEGLKDVRRDSMAFLRGQPMGDGVFTFPFEFAAVKAPLSVFIATFFEENPFQFKPIFRGFYFTSALQVGDALSACATRVAQRFGIKLDAPQAEQAHRQQGYFLLNMFRKVIFADKDLVAQYVSPFKARLRYAVFFSATALVGLLLAGWSWSYLANRELIDIVEASLQDAAQVQQRRSDLQSRFEALHILEERLRQLQQYRRDKPLALGLGLYQGDELERKLRKEYFSGVHKIMLAPVGRSLEGFLAEVNNHPELLQPGAASPSASLPGARFDREAAYNALKTYLMLGAKFKSHADAGHLNDQLTRYWRDWLEANRGAMTTAQMIGNAERVITFYAAESADPSLPAIENNPALVDATRAVLKQQKGDRSARARVYASVKARAATLYKAVTVAGIVGEQDRELVLGSHAISGAFTREAWLGHVKQAFHSAATAAVNSSDWVLQSTTTDDLSLEGSPEQIERALVEMYTADYIRQWQQFVQGVSIRELDNFDAATVAMNRLGDPQTSPLNALIATVHEQTSWDNPSLIGAGVLHARRGAYAWFKEMVLRQKPPQVNLAIPAAGAGQGPAQPLGPVAREFAGVARLVAAREQGVSVMGGYLEQLSKIRTRFNLLKNQGDPGPGARLFMQQTFDGSGSELDEALKYVDSQMLVGMTELQKETIRPILVRPLVQSFSVIVKPAAAEINKVWLAQVRQPFQQKLAAKFPFASGSTTAASMDEIGLTFGPSGTIAKFFDTTVGPLVVRRGDALNARTWGGVGIKLAPTVVASFPGWIAPLDADGAPADAPAEAGLRQTMLDLQPLGVAGGAALTIEADGQVVHWKGEPQAAARLLWPNPTATPGARISAITPDGRSVVMFDQPGAAGIAKMLEAATRRNDGNSYFLTWSHAGLVATAKLVIVGTRPMPQTQAQAHSLRLNGLSLPESVVLRETPVPANVTAAAAGGAPIEENRL